jgi:hypothetical protein
MRLNSIRVGLKSNDWHPKKEEGDLDRKSDIRGRWLCKEVARNQIYAIRQPELRGTSKEGVFPGAIRWSMALLTS